MRKHVLSEVAIARNLPQDVLSRLEPLLDRPGLEEEQVTRLLYLIPWAHVCISRVKEADSEITVAVNRSRRSDHRLALVDLLRVLGIVRTKQQRWAEARDAFAEAESLAASMPYPYARARALHEWGRMEYEAGETEQATVHLSEALVLFRDLGAVRDAAAVEERLPHPID